MVESNQQKTNNAILTISRPFGLWERMIAFRYLRSRRDTGGVSLISIISFAGILLAVAVLIIVMSVMNGFRTELLDRVLGVNGHVFVDSRTLSPQDLERFVKGAKTIEGVKSVHPLIQGQVLAQGGENNSSGAMVQGLSRDNFLELKMVADKIVDGTLENYGKGENGGEEIAIGSGLARSLGVVAGDYITLIAPDGAQTVFGSAPRSKDYQIGAVFSIGMSEYDKSLIYMPLEQAKLYFSRDYSADMIELRIQKPDASAKIMSQLANFVDPALISDWRSQSASLVSALGTERAVMRLILMLLVVIAALNIISGLVMLVKNKGRDIAVLRTMGATRGSIMRIFIMIGASIGIMGTIFGVAVGTIFCVNIGLIQKGVEAIFGQVFPSEVYFLSQIPAHVEWSEVSITAIFSFIMSVLVTIPPAWRAANLDPVEALRYE
jgi:lipoprotein-releasing system permease protein